MHERTVFLLGEVFIAGDAIILKDILFNEISTMYFWIMPFGGVVFGNIEQLKFTLMATDGVTETVIEGVL